VWYDFRAFSDTVGSAMKMFLAVPEGGGRTYNMNEHSQGFKEGKDIAAKQKATFVQVSHSFKTQSKCSPLPQSLSTIASRLRVSAVRYLNHYSLFSLYFFIPPPQNVGGLYWIRFVASVGRSVRLQFLSAL